MQEDAAAEESDKDDDDDDFGEDKQDDDRSDDNNEDHGEAPGMGFHIGVYVLSSLEHKKVLNEIEPSSEIKEASDFVRKALPIDHSTANPKEGLISQSAASYSYEVIKHHTLPHNYVSGS